MDSNARKSPGEEHAKAFTPQALNDPSTGGNPRPTTERDFEELCLRCIRTELAAS